MIQVHDLLDENLHYVRVYRCRVYTPCPLKLEALQLHLEKHVRQRTQTILLFYRKKYTYDP